MKKIFEDIKNKYNNVYLFKRDIQGNVIYWMAKYADNVTGIIFYYGRIHSSFLQDDYKSLRLVDYGKNIGQSNETTPQEQAYKELESEYKDHIKKGYKKYDLQDTYGAIENILEHIVDKTNTDALGFAKPMKCQKFQLSKVKYPCIGQPKYNGVRATISINHFNTDMFNQYPVLILSKEGVEYKLDHLNKQLFLALKCLEHVGINNPVLDGEIYLPNTPVTTIGGAARNINNPVNKQLQYVIFDLSIENVSQNDRLAYLLELNRIKLIDYHHNELTTASVYLSTNDKLHSDEEALELLDICLKEGYEGAVTRQYEPEYAFGQRPMFMRKLKKFDDAEFEVVDIIPYGDANQNVGTGCKFILRNDLNDSTFECIPKGTTAERLAYFANKEKYIGNMVTAKFYERTINNLPFHANVIGLRNYENDK